MSDPHAKKSTRRQYLRYAVQVSLVPALLPLPTTAKETGAIRIVVPFSSGGAPDFIARLLSLTWSAQTGKVIIVENRAGANGIIGTDVVAKAAADGRTLLLQGPSLAINPSIYRKLPFDAERDLRPVVTVCTAESLLFVVNARSPFTTLDEFLRHAKNRNAKIAYSSPGTGNALHLASESFLAAASLNATHIPYKGAGEAVAALLAEEVDFMFASVPAVKQQIQAGKLRLLAVAGSTRSADFPSIPTFNESGLQSVNLMLWYGLFAPSAIADQVAADVQSEVQRAIQDEKLRNLLSAQGMKGSGASGQILREIVHADIAKYHALTIKAGIIPE
ncbi:Bug family tripartite tricarboxylate transporter substrate binding protein [Curvibacter lanceolatus]|uniref:Bug family tripartite tricarboxylate transporter substrate binding protein n=1 Tax=Curvibacter lanceolatus TaxID=86182 RepID=UPI0012FC4A1B|nr:tripartite tricarboxylate transporter substrate-binding protein [Curvibacter lanceolatus]